MSRQYQTWAARASQGIACLLLVVLPLTVQAEEMPVPANIQVPLILKILTFDRNFSHKITSALSIGIVYDPLNPLSNRAQTEIAQILDQYTAKTIRRLPIKYVSLEYSGEQPLDEIATVNEINVFYIMPGMAEHLPALLRFSQAHRITTVTGVPDYVEKGVAVGIGMKKNRKPGILINLPASKSQGNAFEANLLRLAVVFN
ncbi:MAG: YfiR family protein [Candidatus Tectomicrobia bacterium]|nr:YfiR family protein [Candidatus Tectomicrobia bacterium]